MNANQSNDILNSMINFIKSHGDERVKEIMEQANQDFSIGKEKMCEAEKARLAEKLEKDLNIAEVNMKIKRSAELNTARIDKMRKTNELVESLQLEAKKKMAENLKQNPKSYQELLKNLLVQGLIKLIEPKVILRVRKSDLKAIQGLINDAVKIYKDLMLKQVKALKGKTDIPCEVTVDEKTFLPEWNAEDQKNSCLGGFVIYAKKNRIVCSQTLDDRMSLVFQQAIPDIRANLFPSLVKKAPKPVEHKKEQH